MRNSASMKFATVYPLKVRQNEQSLCKFYTRGGQMANVATKITDHEMGKQCPTSQKIEEGRPH